MTTLHEIFQKYTKKEEQSDLVAGKGVSKSVANQEISSNRVPYQ